jgi:O-glycosyl hydrolase
MQLIIIFLLMLVMPMARAVDAGLGKDKPAKPDVVRFEIDSRVKYQTISNFSASDGWSMQYIGLWPEAKRNQIADWLFSTEMDENGKPKGIGLSMWRFNIGAGSKEQGEASQIGSEWTRAECFLLPDGSYDWTKHAGQRKFLQLAKDRGVDQFLGFILSAPVYWTYNGLATNTGRGASFNLKEDKYLHFVRFIADVIEGLHAKEGVKLSYIAPFNEPDGHWNWTGPKQEGTPATNREIARTVRLLGRELQERQLESQIVITESFDYNCIYQTHPYSGWERGYQAQSFFSPDSVDTYLGDVPNMPRLLVGHSYWTNTPISDLRRIRMEMSEVLRRKNIDFWQTEVCIMSNDEEIGRGGGVDLTMNTALYMARVIHHDLVYAHAGAWQWWRSVATSDYKDGLIYANPDENRLDGSYSDSRLMWVLGNYSRFIRPGAVRLGVNAFNNANALVAEGDTDPYGLMISAYLNADNTPVVVVINYHEEGRECLIDVSGFKVNAWIAYRTSDLPDETLTPNYSFSPGRTLTIPARSVITLVGK